MAKKKLKTAISIDPDVWKRLERVAKASQRSRSAMVEQLLRDGLDDAETAVKAFTNPVILEAFGQVFADRSVLRAMTEAVKSDMTSEQLDLFVQGVKGLAADAGLSRPESLERPEAGPGVRADRREHRTAGPAAGRGSGRRGRAKPPSQ